MDARPPLIELRTLGTLDARPRGGAALQSILAQPKRTALLVYLALARPHGLHQRDTLLALFWGERDTERARKALRQALYYLKSSLGDDALLTIGDGEVGVSPEHVWCDAIELERAIQEHRFEDAVSLYVGELLPGFHVDDAPEFERWVDEERAWLRGRAAEAAWRLALQCEAAGDAANTVHWARHAASLSPADETVVRRLMGLLDRVGDRAAALRAFDEFADLLRREYETEPSPETVAQADALRQRTAASIIETVALTAEVNEQHLSGGDGSRADGGAGRRVEGVRGALQRNRTAKAGALPSLSVGTRIALAALTLTVITIVTWGAFSRAEEPDLDQSLVALFPFRMSGNDPALEDMGEWVMDLLAIKLQDGARVRAADPRGAFALWRRSGGESGDLTEADLLDLARRLGAAELLTGEVVSAGRNVVINATLRPVSGGRGVSAEIEGSADSLTWLVERLARSLLSRDAGEHEDRLALLTTASTSALKDYLRGQAEFRRANYPAARDAFLSALERDSTFALAGLALAQLEVFSGGRATRPQLRRANRIAWYGRERLSPIDRAMLHAVLATRYPQRPTPAEACRGWDRAFALAPDRSDLMYWMGDCAFHYGPLMDIPDHLNRARVFFERSFAADSSSVLPLQHLIEIAAMRRDTTRMRALSQIYATAGSSSEGKGFYAWLVSLTLDSVPDEEILTTASDNDKYRIMTFHHGAHVDVEWGDRAQQARVPSELTADVAVRVHGVQNHLLRGRHAAAHAEAMHLLTVNKSMQALRQVLVAATYSEVDKRLGQEIAAHIASLMPQEVPDQGIPAARYRLDTCALTHWRLSHGDTTGAEEAIRILRDAGGSDTLVFYAPDICATTLQALIPYAAGSRNLKQHAKTLDSLSIENQWEVGQIIPFAAARLLEATGDVEGALRALQRREHWLGVHWLQEAFHRESGRLAEMLGDTARARLEYERYLAFRTDEDEGGRAASSPVRAALARLTGQKAGHRQ